MNFYALIIWLMLIPAVLSGQEITRDSSWLVNNQGNFYQARLQEYSNGNSVQTLTFIGDTVTTATQFQNTLKSEAARLNQDANLIIGYRSTITEIIRFGKALPAVIGRSPYDSLRNAQPNLLATGYWGINTTGLRFRVTAQGAFQWKADSTSTWRPAAFIGDIIRLNSLEGWNTDFFRKPGTNRFVSLNSRYVIRPIGSQQRDIDPLANDGEEPEPPRQPAAKLNNDGSVTIDGKKFKYNTKTKVWRQI